MPTLTYATASWCTPCKQLLPKVRTECTKLGVDLVVIDIDTPGVNLPLLSVPSIDFGDTGYQQVGDWLWPAVRKQIQILAEQESTTSP